MQMNIQGVFTEASLTGKLHERQYVATETKSVIAMCDGGGGTSPGMYVWTATAVPGGSSTSMYEVSNGTGVSSVLSSDIEVAKRREIMIYVKQPTTSTYRTGGCCRTTVFAGEGGWRRRVAAAFR